MTIDKPSGSDDSNNRSDAFSDDNIQKFFDSEIVKKAFDILGLEDGEDKEFAQFLEEQDKAYAKIGTLLTEHNLLPENVKVDNWGWRSIQTQNSNERARIKEARKNRENVDLSALDFFFRVELLDIAKNYGDLYTQSLSEGNPTSYIHKEELLLLIGELIDDNPRADEWFAVLKELFGGNLTDLGYKNDQELLTEASLNFQLRDIQDKILSWRDETLREIITKRIESYGLHDNTKLLCRTIFNIVKLESSFLSLPQPGDYPEPGDYEQAIIEYTDKAAKNRTQNGPLLSYYDDAMKLGIIKDTHELYRLIDFLKLIKQSIIDSMTPMKNEDGTWVYNKANIDAWELDFPED